VRQLTACSRRYTRRLLAGGRCSLVLASAFLVTACGGGGSATTTTTTVPPVTPPPVSTTPHVSIQATGPTGGIGGNDVGYINIILTSDGDAVANNVTVSPTWGTGISLSAIDAIRCTATGGAQCSGLPVSWSIPSMPVHSTATLQVPAAVSGGVRSPLSAQFTISAEGQVASTTDTVSLTIDTWSSDVAIFNEGPLTLSASATRVTWIVNVLSVGPDSTHEIQLTDSLDGAQSLAGITCTAYGAATCPDTLGLKMTSPGLPAGGRLRLAITANIAAASGPLISNSMTAASLGDINPFDDSSTATTPIADPPTPIQSNYMAVQSDPDDFLGGGQVNFLTQVNSIFGVSVQGSNVELSAAGDDSFHLQFSLPAGYAQLAPGIWSYGTFFQMSDPEGRAPLQSTASATVGSRSCDGARGVLAIDRADYTGGNLQALDLRLVHHCESWDPTIHAQIHWQASDTSSPLGPTLPIPSGLWSADPSVVPTSGNYAILKLSANSPSQVFNTSNSTFSFSTGGGPILTMNVLPAFYTASFAPMSPLTQLQRGYYPHVKDISEFNRAYGGLGWSLGGETCGSSIGWFAVDNIQWSGSTLTALDLRFGNTCGSGTDPAYGQIHWVGP